MLCLKLNHTTGYLLWMVIGTVIGCLVTELSSHQFQRHVSMFYPPGIAYSQTMRLIASMGYVLLPFALAGPAVGAAWYCWRSDHSVSSLFLFSVPTFLVALLASPSVQGHPDAQPFRFVVTACVFVATFLSLCFPITPHEEKRLPHWRSGREHRRRFRQSHDRPAPHLQANTPTD